MDTCLLFLTGLTTTLRLVCPNNYSLDMVSIVVSGFYIFELINTLCNILVVVIK